MIMEYSSKNNSLGRLGEEEMEHLHAMPPLKSSDGSSISALGESDGEDNNHGKSPKKKKRNRDDMEKSDDELLEEKRAKNRLAATKSRMRKRRLIESLESQVDKLEKEKKELNDAMGELMVEIERVRRENATLVALHNQRRQTNLLTLAVAPQQNDVARLLSRTNRVGQPFFGTGSLF